VRGRNTHITEEHLALVQRALADLVERSGAIDAGRIERHQYHRPAAESLRGIQGAEQHRDIGDAAVGDPRRLLAVDHVVLAVLARDAVGAHRGIGEAGFGECDRIAAVVRFGERPAADRGPRRIAEARVQRRIAALLDPRLVKMRQP